MAIKKSELYSSLWQSCDELRGGMDASQYKDYVLVLLFVKYVSDRYAGQAEALIEVPPGGSFADMAALRGDKEIGDKINKIIAKLAEANDLRGVIDVADFNNPDKLGQGKDMVDRLSNLVAIFMNPSLDFSRNRAEGDDLLGDAYEYLMRHFATESGKSKGQFYTPAEVSRIMAQVIGIRDAAGPSKTLYDPTNGSGSLLLKSADEARNGITIYGQEMDNATYALARMNMILHGHPTALLWNGNTLSSPHFTNPDGTLRTFDYAVANPPFSNKAWTTGLDPYHDPYGRFELGVPPAKNGDYAFFLHLLCSLKSTGKGAIILPHGVLFRGNVEGEIRKQIVRRGYIKGIIGLPPNLFYGTGIPACIVVLDKEHAAGRSGIFMIDASRGFIKDGPKNRLRHQDIHRIVDTFNRQLEIPGYSRLVPFSEISDPKNDYNLNIPRYIDSSEPEDLHDIEAHLLGGIPHRDLDALAPFWEQFPSLRERLFAPTRRPGYSDPLLEPSQVKATILAHPEFVAYAETVRAHMATWQSARAARLKAIDSTTQPKRLIAQLSEDLLRAFAPIHLVDPYDVYQRLMTYWTETMQDDVYLIVDSGWREAARLRQIVEERGQKHREKPDLTVGKLKFKSDLIAPALLIARYFAAEQQAIDALEVARDEIARQIEELEQEHTAEGGLLEDAANDKGKLVRDAIVARLRQIAGDPDSADESALLRQSLTLLDQRTQADRRLSDARKALDAKLTVKYGKLTEDEVRALAVDDKWLPALSAGIQAELDRVSQGLAGRVKDLAERYAAPLPALEAEVATLSAKVDAHLARMGYQWQ